MSMRLSPSGAALIEPDHDLPVATGGLMALPSAQSLLPPSFHSAVTRKICARAPDTTSLSASDVCRTSSACEMTAMSLKSKAKSMKERWRRLGRRPA